MAQTAHIKTLTNIFAAFVVVFAAQAKDCVQAMLQRDTTLRPTAAQLLRHPWICSATDTFSGCNIVGFGSGTATPTPLTSADEALVTPGDTGGTSHTAAGQASSSSGGSDVERNAPGNSNGVSGFDDTLVQRLQRYGTYGRFKQVSPGGTACEYLGFPLL